jgi:hypothetical protein
MPWEVEGAGRLLPSCFGSLPHHVALHASALWFVFCLDPRKERLGFLAVAWHIFGAQSALGEWVERGSSFLTDHSCECGISKPRGPWRWVAWGGAQAGSVPIGSGVLVPSPSHAAVKSLRTCGIWKSWCCRQASKMGASSTVRSGPRQDGWSGQCPL